MTDHLYPVGRARPAREIIGVRDLKTHAARIVRQVRDVRASYVLTHRGRAVGVILPLDPADGTSSHPDDADTAAAWETFLRAGRRLERRFRPGMSGVRVLSKMRR